MAIGNHNDLTHIVRTSDQWKNTYDKYELIPVGVLCVELVSSDVTKIKIGDGHNIFSKLPYIGDLDLSKYYTKLETDTRIKEILTQEKVVRIKGIIGSKNDLPAEARCGDIYFVRQLSSSDNKYIEYIYSPDNTWEPLGGIPVDIDLSEYAKTAYVDDKIEQVNERIDDIEQHGTHTHSNKEILDQITEPYTTADKETLASLHNYDDTEIREMISQSSHTHANKDILDATSAAFTREDKSKLDQLNPYDDSTIKERITELERVAHEHSNKRILDQTTASFTKEYERKMRWIRLYTGCTGMEEGIAGLVPAAQAGEEDYVLSGSGEWVPQTGGGGTYELPIATTSTLGGIKVGDGLEIDANGKLSVVGGGGGGDSIAEGDGITITTDPQTGVKTISVNTGDHLSVDSQTGELNVTGVDYEAGQGIRIGAEYRQLEYIKSTGIQYLITDIILRYSDSIQLDMMYGNNIDTIGVGDTTFRNAYLITDGGYQIVSQQYSTYRQIEIYIGYDFNNTNSSVFQIRNQDISSRGILTISRNGSSWKNESRTTDGSIIYDEPTTGMQLLVYEGNPYTMYEMSIYGLKIIDSNNELIHNLIPTERISDGEAGLYDTITDKFYGNAGNGSFVKGPVSSVDDRLISAKIGNGLQFDSNNAIEIDPSIIPEVPDYRAGDAIEIKHNEYHLSLTDYSNNDFIASIILSVTNGTISKAADNSSFVLSSSFDDCYTRGSNYGSNGSYPYTVKPLTQYRLQWDSASPGVTGYTMIFENGEYTYVHVGDQGTVSYIDFTTAETTTFIQVRFGIAYAGNSISISNIRLYEYVEDAFEYEEINVKYNKGLIVNQDNELEVNIGTGLEIDPQTGAINVTGGSGGGDTVEAGDGIDIDTDSQTGNKVISVSPATQNSIGGIKIGDGLSIDENGVASAKVYEAGQGIVFDEATPEGQFKVRNLEYYFDNQISCQIDGTYGPRTFTRVSQYEQCLAVIWPPLSSQGWANPLFVGLTENSVKLTSSADSNILGPTGSFEYRGYTWYYTCTYGLMNSSGIDLLGNLQTMNYTDLTDEADGAKHLIDLAGLVLYEESIDVWNSGTGWLNGAYNDSQSDQFWTNWYYTYHSKQNEYFEVPAGAIKMRQIGISNENDSRLQGGGVDCFNSSHHHFTTIGCITDEWFDIPEGTVYLQFGVKWNELNNRTISSSDIKSVTIEFYYDTPRNDVINAKLGNGLEFDSNDAIQVKLGTGLGFDANGALEVTGGGGGNYSAGEAITIRDVSSTLPAGYVEVDYIEGVGNYTVINYIPNRKTKVVGTASQTQTSYDPVVFGNRTGSNGQRQQFVFWFNRYDSTRAKVGFVYGTNTWSTSSDCDDGKLIPYTLEDQFTFLISLDDEFNINDSFVHNITENGAPASNLKLGIFALVSTSSDEIESSDQIFRGRMYEFKIYEDDELVVNLIPAISTSTNQGGFYDVINDIFYTSKTATPFGYDPSTIHSTGKVIDVNYGNSLTVNQNNELEINTGDGLSVNANGEVELSKATANTIGGIKVGDGLSIESDGTLSVVGGSGGGNYSAGDAIEFETVSDTHDIVWSMLQMSNDWVNKAYTAHIGGSFTNDSLCVHSNVTPISNLFSIPQISAIYTIEARDQNDNLLHCLVDYHDAAGNHLNWNGEFISDPTKQYTSLSSAIYISVGVVNTDHSTPLAISNVKSVTLTWKNVTETSTEISVKYGTGLSVDPITNELFVNGQLPEGTIIKKLTYVGDGSTTNSNIHFSKKPLSILSLNGLVGQNYGSVISTPIDAPYLHGVWGGSTGSGTSFRSPMSYDNTTNTLSIQNTSDVGLAFNISGVTYTMFYLTKGHTGSGTSVNNEVSVVKTFSYVGTGTSTNNIQFPETPDMILKISGPLATGDITTAPIEINHPTSNADYMTIYTQHSGSNTTNVGYGTFSFNDSTNILTLTGGDYGDALNYSGGTYYVQYIVNEVIASSNYVEGDGIEIDPVTGEISVNIGTGLAFDPQTGAINVTGGGGGSGDTVAEGAGIEITTDQQTGNKVIAVNTGTGLQVDQTTNELEIDDSVVTEDDELNLVFVPDDYQPS